MSSPHAQNLASAGVNAAQGNWVAAAASVAKSLFGGSGKTPSILQGFEVTGRVGPQGFTGEVAGFDQKGNRWTATGETAYLQSLGRNILTADYFHSPLDDATVDRFFADGIPVPFMLRIDSTDNTTIPATIQAALNQEIKSFMSASAPAAPFTPTGSDAPAQAAQAAAQPTVVVADSGIGQLVPVLLLLGVGYFLMKKG